MRSALALALLLVFSVVGCQAAPEIGASCTRSSDCPSSLVCRDARCRQACVANRDCPVGARCLLVAGIGTCSLDDDLCAGASTCPTPLLCVAGECVNACTSVVECPPDATCEPTGDGRARCVASSGIDGGVGDAGTGSIRYRAHGGTATSVGGFAQVDAPTDAVVGDVIVLMLDRFGESAPVATTIGAGWMPLGNSTIDADVQEIVWRRAATDEGSDTSRYHFPAAFDCDWVLLVVSGASSATSVGNGTSQDPYVFAAVTAPPGDLLLEILNVSDGVTSCVWTPTDPTAIQSGHWVRSDVAVSSSMVAARSVTCSPAPSAFPDGESFQVLLAP